MTAISTDCDSHMLRNNRNSSTHSGEHHEVCVCVWKEAPLKQLVSLESLPLFSNYGHHANLTQTRCRELRVSPYFYRNILFDRNVTQAAHFPQHSALWVLVLVSKAKLCWNMLIELRAKEKTSNVNIKTFILFVISTKALICGFFCCYTQYRNTL